jgi:isoleucyl-tRNA synthetase
LDSDEVKTLLADWIPLLAIRDEALKSLEVSRKSGHIGKALEANIELEAMTEDQSLLSKYQNALPELLNVSHVITCPVSTTNTFGKSDVSVVVKRAEAPKCDRCWRHVPDVGQQEKYPTVCLRCAEALDAIDFPPYPAP